MTNHPSPTAGTHAPARVRLGTLLILCLGSLVGLAAGVYWHGPISQRLGLSYTEKAGSPDAPGMPAASGQLWTCSMHPQVIQDKPGQCPICHMQLTPLVVTTNGGPAGSDDHPQATGASAPTPATARTVKYWWDPMMNPPYMSDKPGKSSMGMDLVPVYEDQAPAAGATVTIDPAIVQNMGVRVATVAEGPLRRAVRAVGYLDEAQPNIRDINLRVSGWVEHLHADTEGMLVAAGDPLFDLYSPELQVAVEELISARRARASLQSDADEDAQRSADSLLDAPARKLELWGLDPAQVQTLAKLDHAPRTITFVSPIAGSVTEKMVVSGAAVKAGDRIIRIVDYSTLWLNARVFEKDLALVAIGQSAAATIASRPGETVTGQIIFVDPRVDPSTRTATVRLAVPNPSLALKPGMYATVRLDALLTDRAVLVPREAVIDTGETQIAFVALPQGRFEPRRVTMGPPGEGGLVQIASGLSPGELVVVSGQFLLDSESRLREAIQKFLDQKRQMPTAGPPATPPGHSEHVAGSPPPDGNTRAPDPASGFATAEAAKVDAVIAAYLNLSGTLGTVEKAPTPVDPDRLINAARALGDANLGPKANELAAGVLQAAEAMRSHPTDHQREAFKSVSEKVIALVDALPPSKKVAESLYLMHCPMAPGSWLQTTSEVANPYYATEMKRCGELVRSFAGPGSAQR